ncbi:MAG: SusD/RagB family nutrient-binding outer membrane lipoprotein [Candidatus Kapabacteria bacterium]|nr:SusD/RagB family nutrient-binding outer membrane lipoprotein [Candidatus Kapabacteria bacterium]
MKNKIIIILATFLVVLTACDQWIDTGLNNDPTKPSDVSLNVLLPTTQSYYAFLQGGDIFRFTNMFTQHLTGILRQHSGIYQYIFTESDVDNLWNSLYADAMQNMNILIEKSKASNSPYYQGIGEVMMALAIGTTTDIWGDVPFSEALKGEANLTPKYDSQEQIYNKIFELLNSAIANLAATSSTFTPAGDDLIFKGDKAKWTKAAYSLLARYYLHIKRYDDALNAIAKAQTAVTDDFIFNFGTKGNEANPIYQFMEQRGDISMGAALMKIMNDVNDPRLPFYAEKDNNDKYSEESTLGPYYYRSEAPIHFTTYAEMKFIEAECKFAKADNKGAYDAYLEGIKASCARYGVAQADIDAFVADPAIAVGENNITLEKIMTQKYVAMYCTPETWVDWRRTNFPKLTPISGTQIPRRFPYAQSERLFNGANLQAAVPTASSPNFIFSKVWWDTKW